MARLHSGMRDFELVDSVSEGSVTVELLPGSRATLGRLRFDPHSRIQLSLMNHGPLNALLPAFENTRPVILGQLSDGQPFTLVDCMMSSVSFGPAKLADLIFVGEQLVVGMHLSDRTTPAFDEIRVAFTGLNNWIGQTTMRGEESDTTDPEGTRTASVICDEVHPFGFSSLPSRWSLQSSQSINRTIRDDEGTIRTEFSLILRPPATISLTDCMSELLQLQSLLSILCGQHMPLQRVQLRRGDTSHNHNDFIRFLPRIAQRSVDSDLEPMQRVLLPLPSIRQSLAHIWSTWRHRFPLYQTAVELHASTESLGNRLQHFQFLALMQALETFHRNRFDGTYTSETEYASISVALLEAIPQSTPSPLRHALKSRIQFGNEFGLRKRMKRLANGLPGGLKGHICSRFHPSLDRFIDRAVDTRNYFTHYTPELSVTAFREVDLYWATRLLRWFFVVVLLNDLGLSDAHLDAAMSRAFDLESARQRLTPLSD